MSNLKVHLVYNGEPCLVLSLSKMVKHDFGKIWQEPSRFVKDGHDMSWHCQVLSCHVMTLWMTCHGNVMTKNLVMVFVMVTKCSVTFCHILSSWQKKKCVTRSKNPVSTLTGKSKKRARLDHTSQTFFVMVKKALFLSRFVTVTNHDNFMTNRDKPWQTMTNHDKIMTKPWQLWQTLDNTMTNLDNPWQYHDKPWQSSWKTLIFHDNTM